MTMSRNG